jgi:hypothetical protein
VHNHKPKKRLPQKNGTNFFSKLKAQKQEKKMAPVKLLKSINGENKLEFLIFMTGDLESALKEWKSKTDVDEEEYHDEFIGYMRSVVRAINFDGTCEFKFEFEDDEWNVCLKSYKMVLS